MSNSAQTSCVPALTAYGSLDRLREETTMIRSSRNVMPVYIYTNIYIYLYGLLMAESLVIAKL